MKKIFLLLGFILCAQYVWCQDSLVQIIRHDVDSILQKIEQEPEEERRLDLLLSIYKTRIEGYPLLVIEIAQKLFILSQRIHDPITETASWSFYGQGYRLSGNYIKGLECHHKAVALAESTGNRSLLAIAQNQMGHIYKDREEYEKALRLYSSARENAKSGESPEAIIWPVMNLGAVFLGMNQLDSALFYSTLAYEKSVKLNIPRNAPYILMNIAGAYSKMGDNAQAVTYFDMAIKEAIKNQSPRFRNQVYVSFAEHFQRNNQQDSCVLYAKKAIDAVQNSVFLYLSMKPAKLLTDIYESSNADSTLKYLKLYRTANDSLFSTRANQQLQMMTFDEDQRQQELAAQKEKYQYKIKMNVMLGGLGTFLLLALILFRNNKQKQKANALLHRQKAEIQTALSQLKSTQAQLVHSEKMASLGELTAGIAHEIQNPLNFVNNFSEVNTELIDELQHELKTGNTAEAITISNHIKDNEEKINHHGKRADAIVKGMLQHSRSSSGVKEPTDINALADEYLRLAYHGLRAKDKTFNATMKTDYDPGIGLVNVIPQDIGRVILNLITNAFYVVNEKKNQSPGEFDPTVTVITKKLGDHVLVHVKDNGPGIPSTVLDKIFQPFFTTKPTGKGTGLGLSLSYDIVKAHGGELKVETKENEGTTFIIQLPISNP
ncbi:MAG: tetratricopeptide repeat protein [Saprospiraceae bacterium]|nr:tetratricopeptide repeat protein [Saprospiraceae bacterium]